MNKRAWTKRILKRSIFIEAVTQADQLSHIPGHLLIIICQNIIAAVHPFSAPFQSYICTLVVSATTASHDFITAQDDCCKPAS